jgi:2-polyprenyl-6-methoxyphenol hydroxylase-like FAD-dependent oxidoreductase
MSPKPIIIVGGGLAGLTLGISLRQRGIPVTIWESGRYPRHRVCGEFISGCGQETLARLGLLDKLIQAGAVSANTAMFLSGNANSLARPLPKPALCLSRYILDALLANIFRELGGDLHENQRWCESNFTEAVVRANGRRAQPTTNGWHWYGLKVHARNFPLQADLEMHIIKNGYVGLTRLPDNEVDVCGLFRRRSNANSDDRRGAVGTPRPTIQVNLRREGQTQPGLPTAPRNDLPHGWHDALADHSSAGLGHRLSNASFDQTSSCSVAALSLHPQRAIDLSELCIGDALTMTPPVTGNGMSMAFESAELAVEPLVSYSLGKFDWTQTQRAVAHACDRAFSRRLTWARWLHWMMFSPIFKGPVAGLVLRSNWLWRTMFTHTR